MFDLLDKVETRGAELLEDQLFDQPDGVPCGVRWFKYIVPPKRFSSGQGQDFPFAHVWILGGDETSSNGRTVVRVYCGIYVKPDRDGDGDVDIADDHINAASSDMKRLVDALRRFGENGNYSPYSLEKMKWQLGDENGPFSGQDQYYVIFDLEFSQEAILNNY